MVLLILNRILLPVCIVLSSLSLLSSPIDNLNVEQKSQTLAILQRCTDNHYRGRIKLIFPNGETESIALNSLMQLLNKDRQRRFIENNTVNRFFTAPNSSLKLNTIRNPKVTLFDPSNGKRSLTFQCYLIKIGKMRIGPFEIPSNKILIEKPNITYY